MPRTLHRWARKNGFLYVLYNLPRLWKGYYPIFLNYPPKPVPRYGYGKPPHPQLEQVLAAGRQNYRQTLNAFLGLETDLLRIPLRAPKHSPEPCWINKWLDALDTLALYGLVALRKPKLYLEAGSGYSTKVARRAIRDQALVTRIISIDPEPRTEIDTLCDEVVRRRLEEVDFSLFQQLEPGDILFVDGSHRCFMNSDVTIFFLEILPRVRPGVLLHLHDIEWPWDYRPERAEWYYSEQYLLATALLSAPERFSIVLPNAHVSRDAELAGVLDGIWRKLPGVTPGGLSFWFEKRE